MWSGDVDEFQTGIRMTVSLYPALFFLEIAVSLCFYGVGKKLNLEIQDELAERRRQFQY